MEKRVVLAVVLTIGLWFTFITWFAPKPQPVPPIYQPELAARAIAYAADHPRRRTYWVGGTTAATLIANRLAPALLDRDLARTGYDAQQTDQPASADRPDNLWQPADAPGGRDYGARGEFSDRSHDRSLQLWISQHAGPVTAGIAGAGLLGAIRLAWRSR